MTRGNFFVAAFGALAVLISGNAFAGNQVVINGEAHQAYREGELIVKYRDGAFRTFRDMENLYQRLDVVDVKRFEGAFKNFEHLTINTAQLTVEQAVADVQRDPSVEYAQPNYMLYAISAKREQPKTLGEPCLIPGFPYPPGCDDSGNPGNPGNPNPPPAPAPGRPAIQPPPAEVNPPVADPDLTKAWGIAKVSADKAWAQQKGSKEVIVAVIDTGIDYNHPDLAANIWRKPAASATGVDAPGDAITGDVVGWDFVHNDNLPFDDNQHGTHCAGVIGATGGNGKGISGVNQKVSIMAVKFLSGEGSGDTAGAIKSIDYAVSRGAKVLSNSWGGKGDDGMNDALKDSISRAMAKGVLFIAASGNDGTDNDRDPVFPASFKVENMITVAATNETDGMAFFSNTGKTTVHVGAPGTNVYSTVPNNKYAKLSGTSMACPHVAGAAALLWAQFPNADYKEIKRKLMENGDALTALNGRTISGKRINVLKALGGS